MKLSADLNKTLFYSFLFALGGAPSIAMLIVHDQTATQDAMLSGFIGLTLVVACILIPVVLIQNLILMFTRHKVQMEKAVRNLGRIYFVLNAMCLLFWIFFMFR